MSFALDMQRERARALSDLVVGSAPAGSVVSVFAGGSLGRDEVWAAAIDGTLEIYSDIDLYVVTGPNASAAGFRETARLVTPPAPPAGVRFLRPADIGVYTREDLSAQPLRPGTAELDTHHLMLYGDESIPRSLGGRSAAAIPAEEALYLLENRVFELTEAAKRAEGRMALAQALKARLDVYSAHAIANGTFTATLAERARRFRAETPPTLDQDARAFIAEGFDAVRDLGAWMSGRRAGEDTQRTLRALVSTWRALAPRILGEEAPPAELVAKRCRGGAIAPNARDVLRLRRRLARSLASIVPAIAVLDRRSPVDALRIDALARCLAAESDSGDFAGHFAYIERLTHQFGFNEGSLEERARRMHAAIS